MTVQDFADKYSERVERAPAALLRKSLEYERLLKKYHFWKFVAWFLLAGLTVALGYGIVTGPR